MVSGIQYKAWSQQLLKLVLIAQFIGCGTIFYPERKGQPSGRLDPMVVALDAVGLLLFFIPGVIAFAVDFNNGTIYLPPESHVDTTPTHRQWARVRTREPQPTAAEIEQIVFEQTGKPVKLQPGSYLVTRLKSDDELAGVNLNQPSLANTSEGAHVRFRCQSE